LLCDFTARMQFCVACRHNGVIPDFTAEENLSAWQQMELPSTACSTHFCVGDSRTWFSSISDCREWTDTRSAGRFAKTSCSSEPPIIAQSGRGQIKDKALAFEAGFNHHLTKPVPLDDLERILANVAV
jgi:hypothetical protein